MEEKRIDWKRTGGKQHHVVVQRGTKEEFETQERMYLYNSLVAQARPANYLQVYGQNPFVFQEPYNQGSGLCPQGQLDCQFGGRASF